MLIAGCVADASPTDLRATGHAAGVPGQVAPLRVRADGPRLVDDAITDTLVRVQGARMCSGTPIAGTVYVVTAAHCVLDRDRRTVSATVVRDGIKTSATAVLVDEHYLDDPSAQFDAAVLVMDQAVPGASATLGSEMPTTGSVTVAGLQPLDRDGTLLRGKHLDDVPPPQGATGTLIKIASAPAACTVATDSLSISGGRVDVPCGLIPGASGGGMFARINGAIVLVGIVSTVTFDLAANGIVPLQSLHELLRHPDKYRHEATPRRTSSARVILS
jgi:hypothetical protein